MGIILWGRCTRHTYHYSKVAYFITPFLRSTLEVHLFARRSTCRTMLLSPVIQGLDRTEKPWREYESVGRSDEPPAPGSRQTSESIRDQSSSLEQRTAKLHNKRSWLDRMRAAVSHVLPFANHIISWHPLKSWRWASRLECAISPAAYILGMLLQALDVTARTVRDGSSSTLGFWHSQHEPILSAK